jgi:hypothetical protein
MKRFLIAIGAASVLTLMFGGTHQTSAQTTKPQTTAQNKQQAPQVEEWSDDFTSDKLDETKWEKFTFEGGSGGKLEVKNGEVRIRSMSRTRAGIRTKQTFSGDLFAIEARLAKVGAALPEPGSSTQPTGFGSLTILFDSSGRNRIEWMLTSDGNLEAWSIVDGRGERLDNRKLATKMKNPVLLVIRKGDEFGFYLNDPKGKPQDMQLALSSTVRNLPKSFHVMLYGYGSSENNWDGLRVAMPKGR